MHVGFGKRNPSTRLHIGPLHAEHSCTSVAERCRPYYLIDRYRFGIASNAHSSEGRSPRSLRRLPHNWEISEHRAQITAASCDLRLMFTKGGMVEVATLGYTATRPSKNPTRYSAPRDRRALHAKDAPSSSDVFSSVIDATYIVLYVHTNV